MDLKITEYFKNLIQSWEKLHRQKLTELTEFELRELENLFILLILGPFAGIPSPPAIFALELAPYLEHEISIMDQQAVNSSDSLAELVSILGVD